MLKNKGNSNSDFDEVSSDDEASTIPLELSGFGPYDSMCPEQLPNSYTNGKHAPQSRLWTSENVRLHQEFCIRIMVSYLTYGFILLGNAVARCSGGIWR